MKLHNRIISFLLAMMMIFALLPNIFAGAVEDYTETPEVQDENIISVTQTNEFKGKKVSILGDSISTSLEELESAGLEIWYVPCTHTYKNGVCTGCGVKEWDTDGDGVLEILAIGNSFSVDALEYAYQIAQNLGIEKIAIGNLYIGVCTVVWEVGR